MEVFKQVAKKLPFVLSVYGALRKLLFHHQVKSKNAEDIFTEIFAGNEWGGNDSVSGTGSDIHQTKTIVEELPTLFEEYNISTMLDIPCGDFHWRKCPKVS